MDKREKQLLEAVIKYYLKYGESVASRTIEKKYKFGISSATIRNTMSDLEEEGFVMKMHSSSGRIPTVKGYKFYLEELLKDKNNRYHREIADKFTFSHIDVDNLFKSVSNIISQVSGAIGFVLEHSVSNEKLSNAKLIYINDREALVTMIINKKFVRTSSIHFKNLTTPKMIDEINQYIEDILNISERDIVVDDILKFLMNIGDITNTKGSDIETVCTENVYLDGILNIIERNEIEINDSLEVLKFIFNNKNNLTNILELNDKSFEKNYVTFGKDLNIDVLQEIVIIHKTYLINKNKITIGLISPIRVDYEKVFAYLDSIRDLSEYIINKNKLRKRIE